MVKGRGARGRLLSTGGFARKDRITHRLKVKTHADIDDGLRGWLMLAYKLDGA